MLSELSKNGMEKFLAELEKNINHYLDSKFENGEIREELYKKSKENAIKNIKKWANDDFIARNSPGLIEGLLQAVKEKRWDDIVYAFSDEISFGTSGIRGLACFNEEEMKKLVKNGIDAPILRGPNTINNMVLLLKSAGLAKYASENSMKSIALGYDSRIRGVDFAELIAKLFLAYGLKVYLFDEACPYPELTFTIPTIGADLGVLISASHNDKRYNGYKICSRTGATIDAVQRDMIYREYIAKMTTDDIRLKVLERPDNDLTFLGGSEKIQGKNYFNRKLIDMHTRHVDHLKNFIVDGNMFSRWVGKLNVGYCAFYGAGFKAVPRILREIGVKNLKLVSEMNRLDGTFPCFHIYQQPDPGDSVAEDISVKNFKKEHSQKAFDDIDFMVATDPDSDRAGFVVKVPANQLEVYRKISGLPQTLEKELKRTITGYSRRDDYSWYLLTADEAFSALLWYRLQRTKELNNGRLPDAESGFIVINHMTTDMLAMIARKYGVGVVKAWVGFPIISGCVDMIWKGEILSREKHPLFVFSTEGMDRKRHVNICSMEQSSGMTILGDIPLPGKYIGQNGNTRDKDGILAATLFTELAAYAKSKGKSVIELLDENIYLDPEIGFFANYAEAAPHWGQFEGPTGLSKKIDILKKADSLFHSFDSGKAVSIAGMKVVSADRCATGKYDDLHQWKGMPDEGLIFYFDREKMNYIIIRPSGTSHCIRFVAQVNMKVNKANLLERKAEAYAKAKEVVADAERLCGAA